MKVIAVIVLLLSVLSIPASYYMIDRPRERMSARVCLISVLYAAAIALLCMRVLEWI